MLKPITYTTSINKENIKNFIMQLKKSLQFLLHKAKLYRVKQIIKSFEVNSIASDELLEYKIEIADKKNREIKKNKVLFIIIKEDFSLK